MEQPESMEPATAKTRVARSTLIVAWTTLFRTSLIGILKTKFAPGRREQRGTHVVARRETWQQRKETDLRSWKTDRRDRWKKKQRAAGKKRGRSAKLPRFFAIDGKTHEAVYDTALRSPADKWSWPCIRAR